MKPMAFSLHMTQNHQKRLDWKVFANKNHNLPSALTVHALNDLTVRINIKFHRNTRLIGFLWTD